jgi:GLPGLI family protein
MKKTRLIAMFMVLLAGTAVAQEQEGVITFETRVNLHRSLPPEREELKSMMPEFRTSREQLFFNTEESLYRPVEEEEEEEFGGGSVRIKMRNPRVEIYTHKTNAVRLTQQELMGKNYLIVDSLKIAPWKFGNETKTILGYVCRQAYYTDESESRKREITAWFTQKIRPFLGPETFNSLPGTVLAIDVNNGERVIVATDIEFRPLKKSEIKAPGAGSRISQSEFRKLMDARQQQMRERGGNVMMRR